MSENRKLRRANTVVNATLYRRGLTLGLALSTALGLGACTQVSEGSAAPALPPEAPEAQVVTELPDCSEANTLAGFHYRVVDALFDGEQIAASELDLDEWLRGEAPEQLGAKARLGEELEALESAENVRVCMWPVNSHHRVTQLFATVDTDTADRLTAAFRSDADYLDTSREGIAVFTFVPPEDPGSPSPYGLPMTVHAIVGDVWVTVQTLSSVDYLAGGLEALFEAAPDLRPDAYQASACAWQSGSEALTVWGSELEPFWPDLEPGEPGNWDTAGEWVDTETYNACLPLSWLTVPVIGGTASSPYTIMLFHEGDYVGTATETARGFAPNVERVSDDSLTVTYRWPREGEATAEASGSSELSLTWNSVTGSVDVVGDLPEI